MVDQLVGITVPTEEEFRNAAKIGLLRDFLSVALVDRCFYHTARNFSHRVFELRWITARDSIDSAPEEFDKGSYGKPANYEKPGPLAAAGTENKGRGGPQRHRPARFGDCEFCWGDVSAPLVLAYGIAPRSRVDRITVHLPVPVYGSDSWMRVTPFEWLINFYGLSVSRPLWPRANGDICAGAIMPSENTVQRLRRGRSEFDMTLPAVRWALVQNGWDPCESVCVVASPGRYRGRAGETDAMDLRLF